LVSSGSLSTLSFMWNVDPQDGPTFTWYVSEGNPIGSDGIFRPSDQIDILLNRVGTNPISGISGDGSGRLSFETTPFWPGSHGNSPPLTLYKGWDGNESYGFQGYYKVQGNVLTPNIGIHDGPVSGQNPKGLRIVPQFDGSGKIINGTIAELYEPYLCSMLGNWADTTIPFPWGTVPCTNPPPGHAAGACPRSGSQSAKANSYDSCWVVGASKGGVGWWTNSPLAANVAYAPFDPSQKWNIMLNVAIGGQWPRGAGEEGEPPGSNYPDMTKTNLKMKSIKYYTASGSNDLQSNNMMSGRDDN